MSKNRFFYFSILAILSTQIAFASIQLNPGEVQLDVSGILLDVEQTSTVDEINFNGASFTVTMSASQLFKISSSEKRDFTVSPTASAVKACESAKSILTIQTSSGVGQTIYTITPGSANTCLVDGGAGEVVAPPPPPPPAEQPPPPPPPTEQPPAEQPPPPPPPTEQPPAPPPITVSETAQGLQTISEGAIQTVTAVTSGAREIFRGVTTGNAGTSFIALNTPNTGIYEWDTSSPLTPEPGFSTISLTPGGYSITIISSSDASVQDATDGTFRLISQAAANQLEATGELPISESAFTSGNVSATALKNFKYIPAQFGRDLLQGIKDLLSAQPVGAQTPGAPSLKIIQPNGGEIWVIGQTYNVIWQYENLSPTTLVNIKITKQFNITETLTNIGKQVQKTVTVLREDPVVTKTVTQVTAPIATTVTVASAGALAVTASTGSAAFAVNLSEILQTLSLSRFYLIGLIRFRRRKPWGRVSDKLSGMPLRGATIQIYEAEFKKLKDSQVTDEEGRFGTLIDPGTYYIKISKSGYQEFQSDTITISSPDQILNLEFYLPPIQEEWTLEYVRRINVINFVKRFVELINPYLLALGTLLSAVSLIIVPSTLNTVTFVIYLTLDFLKIYFALRLIKPLGTIVDETTNSPLALTVVRIFDQEKNWLLATKVADNQGRFNFLLSPGSYYVTCSRAGYLPYKSDQISLRKGAVPSLNIKLKSATQL